MMDDKFQCALASDKHFLRNKPVLISCGHAICKECIPEMKIQKMHKCKICSQSFCLDCIDTNQTHLIEAEVKANLKNLFLATEIRMENTFKTLNENLTSISECIEVQTNYIKDEIEIRVESLKNELDTIYEKLRKDVDLLKIDIIARIKNNLESIQLEQRMIVYNENIAKIKIDIQNELIQNEEKLFEYQNQLIDMNQMIEKVNASNWKMKFEVAKDLCSEKLVGKIKKWNSSSLSNAELRNRLSSSTFETIISDVMPFDICILPNDTIACCNYHNIKVYDENFQLIKTVDTIDNKPFRSRGMTTNNSDSIFISDLQSNQVIKCDLNFNRLASFGAYGDGMNQFHTPKGVCYHNEYIYVCDFNNKRIQKISTDFQQCEVFNIKLNPYYIKIIGNTACVTGYCDSWDIPDLNFYNIDLFELLHEYLNQKGPISVVNSLFYHCDFEKKKLGCYDSEGVLIDEINFERFNGAYANDLTGMLVEFNNDLIISAQSNGKVLKL